MKKTLAALSALTIFFNLDTVIYAEDRNPEAAETDQVIVIMEEDAAHPLENGEVIPVEGEENQLVSVEVPRGETVEGFMEELEKRSDVVSVEPDQLIKLAYTVNDPFLSTKQYHHKKIGTMRAWDQTFGSPDVVVAVIDDGADLRHPDLVGKFVFPYDIVKKSKTAIPAGSHGTHVAGIIGASVGNEKMGAGVAPKTSIMPVNVFNGEQAYVSDVIAGINYAVISGADIINMSLGTKDPSAALAKAVQSAHAKGVLLIAAAGNNGNSTPNYPASYPGVISVGSTTPADTLSSFSNYGASIDITAPGSGIQSTLPGSLFGGMSGTSMATPVVAGVAALVMANEPELSNDAIEKRLYETAKDLGAPGRDNFFGNGRVNAKDAMLLAPAKPEVDRLTDRSTAVKGKAEADAAVTVKKGEIILGSGTATAEETFTITIPKQLEGTRLSVIAENRFEKVSETKEVTVVEGTPPEAPTVFSVYNNAISITGKAESGSTVYAYSGNKQIGKATAVDGSYTMKIAKQPTGTSLNFYAVDAAGNKSLAAKTTVANASVKVSAAAYNKLEVSWSQIAGAQGYEIYRSTSSSGSYSKVSTTTSGSTLSYTNSSLTIGKTYYYKVRTYRTADGKKEYGPYTSSGSGKPAVSLVSGVKAASAGYSKNKISWSKVSGASGYAIYQATSKTGTSSHIKTIGSGSTLSHTKTGLTTGKTYYYKVRAYRTVNGKKYFGPYSSIVSSKPAVPAVSAFKAASAGYNKNKISWAGVSGASGYAIYQATSKTGTYSHIKTIGSGSTLSYIKTGLATGKTYYYKVRAYRTVTGKKYFGPYFGVANAKPTLARPSSLLATKAGSTAIKATWRKVNEAGGYELYRSTNKTGNYSKIQTVTSGSTVSYTSKSLMRGKTYYYKVRAYRIVNGKKIFSSFTAINSYKL